MEMNGHGTDALSSVLRKLIIQHFKSFNLETRQIDEDLFQDTQRAFYEYSDKCRVQDPSLPEMEEPLFYESLFRELDCLPHGVASAREAASKTRDVYRNRARAGAILISEDQKNVLMVRGNRHPSKFGFPKGRNESGESLQQTAIREVKEETGYDIIISEQDISMAYRGYNCNSPITLFFIHDVHEEEDHKMEPICSEEIAEISWVPLSNLPNRPSGTKKNEDILLMGSKQQNITGSFAASWHGAEFCWLVYKVSKILDHRLKCRKRQ